MTFSYNDLISPKEILADVLPIVDDEEMKMFRPGWYMRQVHQGLKKLNFEAPYIEQKIDLSLPENLILDVPSNVFNIIDIYLWSGEDCVIQESHRVYHKSNFHSNGHEQGYTARNKTGQSDSFISPFGYDYNAYFYNIVHGNIYFSDACSSFDNVRIVYNGMPKSIEQSDSKYIPEFCREALISYVVERAFFALKARNPAAYRILWADAKADLYSPNGQLEPSKWDLAIGLIKKLDKKYMDDLSEYLGRMAY